MLLCRVLIDVHCCVGLLVAVTVISFCRLVLSGSGWKFLGSWVLVLLCELASTLCSTMLSLHMLVVAATVVFVCRLGSVQFGAYIWAEAVLDLGLRLMLSNPVTLKLSSCGLLLVWISMPLGPRL